MEDLFEESTERTSQLPPELQAQLPRIVLITYDGGVTWELDGTDPGIRVDVIRTKGKLQRFANGKVLVRFFGTINIATESEE